MAVRIELILIDFAAQCVSVDAENFCGAGLVAVGAIQNPLDETLLEFTYRLIKKDPALNHLIDEPFQLIFHDRTLRCELPS
jgi:hypothetical protein